MLLGAEFMVIALVWFGIGAFIGSRPFQRDSDTKEIKNDAPLEPICACGHHYVKHDLTKNRCPMPDKDMVGYKDWNPKTKQMTSMVECKCTGYVGPIPYEKMLETYSPKLVLDK